MRIGIVPENPLERLALAANLVPVPLAESWFTFQLARTIMVATKVGVFDALDQGPLTASEVAARCATHPGATEKLLNALVGCRYVRVEKERYALAPLARKWLPRSSRASIHDKVVFQLLEWRWWDHAEAFVRSGEPLAVHQTMLPEEWGLYQAGMRAGIEMPVAEVVRRLTLPSGARAMLDIGGSHGYFSVSFCRRYPQLQATILDLPEAIRHAAPILAREGMGDRVVHRAGNALTDDLGEAAFDFVFIASLVHHFDDATNAALVKRIARALRPGGLFAIYDAFRVDRSARISQIGGLMDLFFAMISEAGTYAPEEMARWQRDAGLVPRKPMRLRLIRDVGVQAAVKK
jgi:predicted O-methyltransferase YrrM